MIHVLAQGLEVMILSEFSTKKHSMCVETTKVRQFKDKKKMLKLSIRKILFL